VQFDPLDFETPAPLFEQDFAVTDFGGFQGKNIWWAAALALSRDSSALAPWPRVP